MLFLIGLLVCFVLSICGYVLLASQQKKMKSSNHLSYTILQWIAITSVLLSGVYSIGYLFHLKGAWIWVLRILAVFLRFSLSCLLVCLFHQFSMLSPMTNSRSAGFYKNLSRILPTILSLCYFFFHLDTTNKDSFILKDSADLWLYYIFSGCCICMMICYTRKVNATSKSFGLSSSLSHLLLLRCILPLTLFCLLWTCGLIDSLLAMFSHRCLYWNKLTILFETSFCFWFSLCFLNSTSSKKKNDIQESFIHQDEQNVAMTASQDLSVFIETFNCGEKFITKMDLENIVPLNKDLYIFSLQECLHPKKSIKAISEYLNSNKDYLIQEKSIGYNWKFLGYHGTITVVVAVKKAVVESLNPSTQNTVYEGFNLGCCHLGNKGGVAISLRFPSYSLLVVACHFSSDLKGQSHLDKRNRNAQQVLQSLSPEWLGLNGWDCEYVYDHVIVAGDLNYRVNDVNTDNVFKLIAECAKEENFDKLLEKDELSAAIHEGKVFTGFKEATIHFPPTFKLNKKDKGICYDFSKADKIREVYKTKAKDHTLRIPSYTDRIIWHSLPMYQDAIEPVEDYVMVEEIRKSDHRPVHCQFVIHKKENKQSLQQNPNLVLRLSNLAITAETKEKVLDSKVCCPILSDDVNWEQRCINIIKDGFLINNPEQAPLPPLESSGHDSIEHIISSYSALPLHVALQIQTKNRKGQCIIVLNEKCEKKTFSAEITNGGEKVGTITGEYSLSDK